MKKRKPVGTIHCAWCGKGWIKAFAEDVIELANNKYHKNPLLCDQCDSKLGKYKDDGFVEERIKENR